VSRVIGLDYGTVRVGIAMSDPLRITAQPLEVVPTAAALDRVRELAGEYEVGEVVVGLPRSLSGGEGASAAAARSFADEVGAATGLTVNLVDERFTTHTAERALLEAGTKRALRRKVVDKVAAAVILQHFLDRRP
jgi:putative Holliday junction resolvase